MTDSVRLSGIELWQFRSIGDEPVSLVPWKRCNILVGQNNSGKSNAMHAVRRAIAAVVRPAPPTREPINLNDTHKRSGEVKPFRFRLHFAVDPSSELSSAFLRSHIWLDFTLPLHQASATVSGSCLSEHEHINTYLSHFQNYNFHKVFSPEKSDRQFWSRRPSVLTAAEELSRYSNILFEKYFRDALPVVNEIPEFRRIQEGEAYSHDGTNLIGKLAEYQHPADGQDADIEKFETVQRFVCNLLHFDDARLEVTHDKTEIMLTHNGLRLPLSSYGTGVHELVIMVTAILSMEDALCCIEEPEIHLHPRLQREFVEFMLNETSNQYLLSSHSPTFVNAGASMASDIRDEVQIFHLARDISGATVGYAVLTEANAITALNDLGVQASDILQANCVLWVEGPSDRIYIKHWIHLVAPELVEGLHYSIMFYGGGLRSHLSFERDLDEAVDDSLSDLIQILRLNQKSIVVMDSDRSASGKHLNRTKLRVRDECEESGGIAWVTYGREIENYIPASVVSKAIIQFKGDATQFSIDRYEKFEAQVNNALTSAGAKPLDYSRDKVGNARRFIGHFATEDVSAQLEKDLYPIIEKIREWNR